MPQCKGEPSVNVPMRAAQKVYEAACNNIQRTDSASKNYTTGTAQHPVTLPPAYVLWASTHVSWISVDTHD
jgi:hypothetical protein